MKQLIVFLLLALWQGGECRSPCVAKRPFNPKQEFCCDGMIIKHPPKNESFPEEEYQCCGRGLHNVYTEHCCNGKAALKQGDRSNPYTLCCGTTTYNPETESCGSEFGEGKTSQAKVTAKTQNARLNTCNGKFFDPVGDVCCNGTIIKFLDQTTECCNGTVVDKSKEICCRADAFVTEEFPLALEEGCDRCCGGLLYNSKEDMCCNGYIFPHYNNTNICCGDLSYEPITQVCCQNRSNSTPSYVLDRSNPNATECCGNITVTPGEGLCCENLTGNFTYHPGNFTIETTCCGTELFNVEDSTIKDCCNGMEFYDPTKQSCCPADEGSGYKIHDGADLVCCNVDLYNTETQDCCCGHVTNKTEGMSTCCEVSGF